MAEKAQSVPIREAMPEMAEHPENLPPQDEAIDAVRNEINALQGRLEEAAQKAERPGVTASATDKVALNAELRRLREEEEPRLNALREMWNELGGSQIEEAEKATQELNFNSTAQDRVAAQFGLRDAKASFYGKLKESLQPEEEAGEESPETPAETPEEQPEAGLSNESWAKSNEDVASIANKLGGLRPAAEQSPAANAPEATPEAGQPSGERENVTLPDFESAVRNLRGEIEDTLQQGRRMPQHVDEVNYVTDEARAREMAEEENAARNRQAGYVADIDQAREMADEEAADRRDREADIRDREAELVQDVDQAHEMALEEDADRRDRAADIRDLEAERPEVERSLREIADRERMARREEELAQGIAEREAEGPRPGILRRAFNALRDRLSNNWYRTGARLTMARQGIFNRLYTRENEEGEREVSPIRLVVGSLAVVGAIYAASKWGFETDTDQGSGDHQGGQDNHNTDQGDTDADKGGAENDADKDQTDKDTGEEGSPEAGEKNQEYPADAYTITEGEGWLEAMDRMGIKDPNVKDSILNDEAVMGQLKDMGLAYRAPELGGWGLYLHGGQMPEAALDVLKEAAASR